MTRNEESAWEKRTELYFQCTVPRPNMSTAVAAAARMGEKTRPEAPTVADTSAWSASS